MSGKPYQSCLIPYENEIVSLRRKRPPVSYSRIAELLREKYQITISKAGIFLFIKRRIKKEFKPCKYDAWDIELQEVTCTPTMEAASARNQATSLKPSVSEIPKPVVKYQPRDFHEIMRYSEIYNLTRVSPEEAAARNKQLEEEERNRK